MKLLNSRLLPLLLAANAVTLLAWLSPYLVPLPSDTEAVKAYSNQQELLNGLRGVETDPTVALERPIFHQNRRPPVAEVKVAAPAAPKQRLEAPYSLAGVVGASEASRKAYLSGTQDGQTHVVKPGDVVGGWSVETIGTNFVTLSLDGERRVLELNGGN